MRNVIVTDRTMDAAHVLRGLRTEKGLTLKEVADRCGVSESGLSRWERANRVPNIDVFIKLISALDAEIVIVRKTGRDLEAGSAPKGDK